MRLAEFLRSNVEPLLNQWDMFAKQIYPAELLSNAALRDHARGILHIIADDLDSTQSEIQRATKSRGMAPHSAHVTEAELHGSSRFDEGFDVNQVVAEFRALRAYVLRLWGASFEIPFAEADDINRFNEALDQAVAESVARFTELKDRESRLFEVLLSSSPDLTYIIEPNGNLLYANKAFADVFNRTPGELAGTNFLSLCVPFVNDLEKRIRQVVASRKTYRSEMCANLAVGDGRTFEYLLVPVLNQAGRCEAIAGSARDITERKASAERIRHCANHDALTDLPNRSLFRERLQQEIKHGARTGLPLCLLYIDLDGFKDVNDRLGHPAGDQLLQQVAARISCCVRETDTVARPGGDEFTVILTDVTDPAHIDTIAAKIIGELGRPFTLAAGDVNISASIGIALCPKNGQTPDELVQNADDAMYASKNAGGGQYQLFTAAMSGGAV